MNKTNNTQDLLNKIEDHSATIGIIGMGYVGLPLAIEFAKANFTIIGFDLDETKVAAINTGKSYIKHISDTRIQIITNCNKSHATTDFSKLATADCIIICVPTPLNQYREPDMQYIESTVNTIAKYLRTNQLIVLESTTYPGTTSTLVKPILEETGLRAGEDFFLAFSPEREDPGNKDFSTNSITKIVGGYTENCGKIASFMYDQVISQTHSVSNSDIAEATKLLENIFRSVNIALVNELKIIFDKMGIDIWEVINAASTKPFGYMPFYPGPGLGGHCIPIDPFYLTWKAKEFGVNTRFIELAGEINTAMPEYVINKTETALNNIEKSVKGSNILILGIAYKKDIDDDRESPSLRLIELLLELEANIFYHDPYVPILKKCRKYDFKLTSTELTKELLNNSDAVIISTAHSNIDYDLIANNSRLIIDTRNCMATVDNPKATIIKA